MANENLEETIRKLGSTISQSMHSTSIARTISNFGLCIAIGFGIPISIYSISNNLQHIYEATEKVESQLMSINSNLIRMSSCNYTNSLQQINSIGQPNLTTDNSK